VSVIAVIVVDLFSAARSCLSCANQNGYAPPAGLAAGMFGALGLVGALPGVGGVALSSTGAAAGATSVVAGVSGGAVVGTIGATGAGAGAGGSAPPGWAPPGPGPLPGYPPAAPSSVLGPVIAPDPTTGRVTVTFPNGQVGYYGPTGHLDIYMGPQNPPPPATVPSSPLPRAIVGVDGAVRSTNVDGTSTITRPDGTTTRVQDAGHH
jgi:hypothetical protein